MKNIKLILLLLFFFPISVFADTEHVLVECPKDIKKNTEFICKISGISDYSVSGVELKYQLPDYITYINGTIDTTWEGKELNNTFYLYTDKTKNVSFNIGELKLKSNKNLESLNIEIVNLIYSDSEFQEHTIIDNVNNVKTNEKKEVEKKNNNFKYVIIILIIGILVVSFLIYKTTRSGKNEK